MNAYGDLFKGEHCPYAEQCPHLINCSREHYIDEVFTCRTAEAFVLADPTAPEETKGNVRHVIACGFWHGLDEKPCYSHPDW